MSVLQGWFSKPPHDVRELEIYSDKTGHENPCPVCKGVDTCDVAWVEQYMADWEQNSAIKQSGWSGSCNTFPSGTPGVFQPNLIIFIDDYNFNKSDFGNFMRYRIRKHLGGNETYSIKIVALSRGSFNAKLETSNFRRMVDEWRFIDPTFAPESALKFSIIGGREIIHD